MRSVCCTGSVVDEEWLIGRHGLLKLDPLDGLGRHVRGEVVVLLFLLRHPRYAIKDDGLPLVRLTADEAIELVESGVRRPPEIRARNGDFPGRRFVPFAECGGAVSVVTQRLCEVFGIVGSHPEVAGEAGRHFHDRTYVHVVMVPSRKQGGPGRRTESGRVEAVETQAIAGQPIERRSLDCTSKGSCGSESDVIDQHDHNIGGTLGGFNGKVPVWSHCVHPFR